MKNPHDLLAYEKSLQAKGYQYIAGVDEVGRGPLAGGVLACACILDLKADLLDINDSKKLSEKRRRDLYPYIVSAAKAYAFGYCNEKEIDEINIYQASKLAMKRAVNNLKIKADFLLVDAMDLGMDIPQLALIKGDMLSASIGAASILAKVKRDYIMEKMDDIYPGYGFAKHKGYPTKFHLQQLKTLKPCKIHRMTYKPVKDVLEEQLALDL